MSRPPESWGEAERNEIFVERERAKLDDLAEPPELFDKATPEE